ncbi:hypothetical protein FYK55_16940 [Roseiconus nitratireducens]|uniref:BRCT domain-containing protein n=1 Tax=Roseiconus nitratireducens TaxID=2605748 RepID=A0A5M6D3H5_9BACT|nr:exonuclease domain-containing protein [Roseiconus nitratireducens]KAA5541883.1 hypothetical protein FYK55_16940 [Roseiconus nitratireducens]
MLGGRAEYAVVDVETTGFGKKDRVIEIGVVVLDSRLRIIDEYETLVDPERDLGPTHIHGITPKMISMAPSFGEVAHAVAKRIENRVIVAHNLMFDERMIGQEFGRLDALFDPGRGVCTLKLTGQKLPAACQMLGVSPPQHHRALADAKASAALLKALKPAAEAMPSRLANVPGELSQRTHRRSTGESSPLFERLLSRLVYTEENARLLQYVDLLDWVLDDFLVTDDERKHLSYLADELGLSHADIARAHRQYFQAMVAGAEKDGVVTEEEHQILFAVAETLGLDTSEVPQPTNDKCVSDQIPAGAAICFTGTFVGADGNKVSKSELEKLAADCGFTVVSDVTKSNCDLVVAVDPSSSSGKAKKARRYGKPIVESGRFLEIVAENKIKLCLPD